MATVTDVEWSKPNLKLGSDKQKSIVCEMALDALSDRLNGQPIRLQVVGDQIDTEDLCCILDMHDRSRYESCNVFRYSDGQIVISNDE